jgi:hypothetical protein
LEAKVKKAWMTRLFPIQASPPSHTCKGSTSTSMDELQSYDLSSVWPANMNIPCCFLLRWHAMETSSNEEYGVKLSMVVTIVVKGSTLHLL